MPVYRHPSPLRKSRRKGSPLSDFSREVGEAGTRANWLEKNNLQKIIINRILTNFYLTKIQQTEQTTEAITSITVQTSPLPQKKRGHLYTGYPVYSCCQKMMTVYNCFVRWSKASFLPGNAQ